MPGGGARLTGGLRACVPFLHGPPSPVNSRRKVGRGLLMDGLLHFPVATPPEPGEIIRVAPGILWLRMPLPFALNHINLWLIDDGPTWTAVDTGFALPESKAAWQRIFAAELGGRRIGRVIVTHFHPDHIGLAGWLTEHWQAPLWTTEKEWLHARMMSRDGNEDSVRLRL